MKKLLIALIAGLLTIVGTMPAIAASPWETLKIDMLIVQVASDGSCAITAMVFWSDVKAGRPLDVTFELAQPDDGPANGGASITVPAKQGRAEAPLDNPDGLRSFKVRATVSGSNFAISSGFADAGCPGSSV